MGSLPRVVTFGADTGSTAVKADAAHHLSDTITAAATFIGITVALVGSCTRGATGWESVDDWASDEEPTPDETPTPR
jgi:divalent metal cation (Fe/Co/Zn/Cd) transporter